MAKQNVEKTAFNRGIISPLALARVDVKRVGLAAETQTNWMPRTLGPMSLRPGLQYIGSTQNNSIARHIEFIFKTTDTALLELTDYGLRVRINDATVIRAAVSTIVTNGTFDTDLTGWTSADVGAAVSSWRTGGYMALLGDGTNAAIRKQTLSVATVDQNVEHALRIVITQGPVLIRLGSTDGGDDYIAETTLNPGVHSLAFTPTGTSAYLRLFNRGTYASLVDSCSIELSGKMVIPTPYPAASLPLVRSVQSGDVVFIAVSGYYNSRIERRGAHSWSLVKFVADAGPMRVQNLTPTTITPSALVGEITLTASDSTFRSTSIGALYQLMSTGQNVTKSLGAALVYTDPIRVSGLTATRGFSINTTGTWSATLTLQKSVGDIGNWVDVETYTVNQSKVYNDSLDNQIIYYRIGINAGNYTSGTAAVNIAYAFGTITGMARITAVTSSTLASAVVLQDLGATTATADWAEGAWSDRRGWPSAVAFHDGRLWWAGKDNIWASVSDAFNNYDASYVGDAGPISRSIGEGPVDTIGWLSSAQTLFVGAQGAEKSIRSSTLGEPVTPSNYNMKDVSTYGSASIAAIKIDMNTVFVDRSGTHVMEVATDSLYGSTSVTDLSVIAPEVCEPSVVRLGVQRRPDTRIHCVLSDGTAAVLIFDKAEDVKCWVKVVTNGAIEDVVVLPGLVGSKEDTVYYTVARLINGSTVRYLEKWAHADECVGGTDNKQADAFLYWTGASSTTITGLGHLVGATVVCWANGKDQGVFTVGGAGTITLPEAVTSATVGLGYTAEYRSTKLAYAAQGGSALTQPKRVDHLGLILSNTHYQGLQYGTDDNYLDGLPLVEYGTPTPANTVWASYDKDSVPVNGNFDTDARLILRATAPRPCTVLAAVIGMATNDKM